MRLRQLFEEPEKHAAFCFGRMNPPTIGHAEVFKTLASVGGDYFIFVSQSQDRKENPLSYDEKINFIKAIHPQYADNIVENTALNTVVKVANYLYEQGYKHVTFVAGSDRLDQFKKLLTDYNGVKGKAHGFYDFESIDFKSSGERDPDSPGVSGVSASKARAAAANNDFEGFQEATGAGEQAKAMFDAVRKGMGINEDIDTRIDMDRLVSKLDNERMKNVIEMRFKHKMTYQQIGKELGVNPETARVIEARALRKLRQMSTDLSV